MNYFIYYIPLALIFLGIMSCTDPKPSTVEDDKSLETIKDSKPSIVEDDKSLETIKDSKPAIVEDDKSLETIKDSKPAIVEDDKSLETIKDSKPSTVEDDKSFEYKNNKDWYSKNPILYKGTPVYEAAQAIADKNNVGLRAWAAKASDELLNFRNAQQANMALNLYAYKRGNMEAVKILTEAGADPNLQSDGDYSVFLSSCLKSKKDNSIMTYLLANGGNPNAESSMAIYRTPLIVVSKSNLENVKILENSGANINYIWQYPDGSIDSPLFTALRSKKIHIVNYYIFEKGLDFRNIDMPSMKTGIPPRTILTYLRRMNFKLGTEKHKAKWKLIHYLKEQGLDYKKQPIPKTVRRQHDEEYLMAY